MKMIIYVRSDLTDLIDRLHQSLLGKTSSDFGIHVRMKELVRQGQYYKYTCHIDSGSEGFVSTLVEKMKGTEGFYINELPPMVSPASESE